MSLILIRILFYGIFLIGKYAQLSFFFRLFAQNLSFVNLRHWLRTRSHGEWVELERGGGGGGGWRRSMCIILGRFRSFIKNFLGMVSCLYRSIET